MKTVLFCAGVFAGLLCRDWRVSVAVVCGAAWQLIVVASLLSQI